MPYSATGLVHELSNDLSLLIVFTHDDGTAVDALLSAPLIIQDVQVTASNRDRVCRLYSLRTRVKLIASLFLFFFFLSKPMTDD
jgi:hypothetical protein